MKRPDISERMKGNAYSAGHQNHATPHSIETKRRISKTKKQAMTSSLLEELRERGRQGAAKRWGNHVKTLKKKPYNRDEHRLYMQAWREKNREQDRLSKHRYKMRRRQAQGSHTLEEWVTLKETYRSMCLCCKRTQPEITLTRDHVIPLSKGGTDHIWNIQPLCASCNTSKYTKSTNFMPIRSDHLTDGPN